MIARGTDAPRTRTRREWRPGHRRFRSEHPGCVAESDPGDHDPNPSEGTPIRITFGDTVLAETAPLPRELSLEGAPEGHDPATGDIGYWAPDGDLVFYYDSDAPFFNGIVRIGEFDGEMDAIER